MGLIDFLLHPTGKARGWDALPAVSGDPRVVPAEFKGLTFNGAEYVPPLFHGPGAAEAYDAWTGRYWGHGDGNSAVVACLLALSMAYFEPDLRVLRRDPRGNRLPVASGALSDLQGLLDFPNPELTAKEIWFWWAWALNSDGNAYLEKVRAVDPVAGNVVQLIPRSPLAIRPMTDEGSGNLIDWYKFSYAPGKWTRIRKADMIHGRLGVDDRDHRLGLAPIKRLVRHICADDEASRFATTLLGNYGVPGLVVQTPDKSLDEKKADQLKSRIAAAFGNDNRGNVGILSNGATMSQFGFSPEQLNLKALHQIPETRIAAVMRVPPAVVGLSVGLEQTSNFASFEQVREQFVEQTLSPLWGLRDDKLNAQLLPEFSSNRADAIVTDLKSVRALQEDENALHERANQDLESGGISMNEYRQMVGLSPLPPDLGDCHKVGGRFVPRSEIGMMPELPADDDTPRRLRAVGE
jgi:HK97 family phage portal protein